MGLDGKASIPVQMKFKSPGQERLFRTVVEALGRLGYMGGLLQQGYKFRDWFATDNPIRTAPAVGFGQIPISYDTACIAVLLSNGKSGLKLVNDYRGLGAPLAFEINDGSVVAWRVATSPSPRDQRITITADAVGQTFEANSQLWSPDSVLRAKNISKPAPQQLDFFDLGLIPALEEHVRGKLDPLLRGSLSSAVEAYRKRTTREPDARQLFRLAFWLLAGKVFHDRRISGFRSLGPESGPDMVLDRVAKHYSESMPRLLDRATREVMFSRI